MSSTHSIAHEIRNDFGVPFTHRLLFDRDVLDPANPLVDTVFEGERGDAPEVGMIAVIDQGLADARPGIQEAISRRFAGSGLPELREMIFIPGGEDCKNDPAIIDRILEAIERHRIDRRSYVAIFGGGAVLDAAEAHLGVPQLLETAEASAFREAKKLVDEMLYKASEKLAATEGCESLRMLQSKIKRHDEDYD